jgi:hypothetical protein
MDAALCSFDQREEEYHRIQSGFRSAQLRAGTGPRQTPMIN